MLGAVLLGFTYQTKCLYANYFAKRATKWFLNMNAIRGSHIASKKKKQKKKKKKKKKQKKKKTLM